MAALAGAAVGALLGSALTTEKGKQLLNSASTALKDLSGKATDYAKENLGEVVRETQASVGEVVKEKIADQMKK